MPYSHRTPTCAQATYIFSLAALAGCVPGKAAEYAVNGSPVTVLVPKDVEGADAPLRGIRLRSMEEITNASDHSFLSLNFQDTTPGALTMQTCRGTRNADHSKYESCVVFDAHIDAVEEPSEWRLTITPTRRRDQPGHDALLLPIRMPQIDLSAWYFNVSHHSVGLRYRIESPFSPEALKANFDRHLRHIEPGEADAAIRQFKDAYALDVDKGTHTRVGVSFYPYHTGSLAEFYILGVASGVDTGTAIDWTTHFETAKGQLELIAKD